MNEWSQWNWRFLDLAKYVSNWSKDPSTQCGAVITNGRNRIVSMGFNGFPAGVPDHPWWLEDRGERLRMVRHAEENAIYYASLSQMKPETIYVHPMPPCARCAGAIIQAGIKRVYAQSPDEARATRWKEEMELAARMYEAAGVELVLASR